MLQESILQYFRPSLSGNRSWKTSFGILFDWPLKTGFTVRKIYHQKEILCVLKRFLNRFWINLFRQVTTFVVCSLICLCSKVAYFANNMDPDQTTSEGAVWSGFKIFASMIKSSPKCTWICTTDVKRRLNYRDKNYWRDRDERLKFLG